jgi:hypothetical protein
LKLRGMGNNNNNNSNNKNNIINNKELTHYPDPEVASSLSFN